jgi:hypothetical protein
VEVKELAPQGPWKDKRKGKEGGRDWVPMQSLVYVMIFWVSLKQFEQCCFHVFLVPLGWHLQLELRLIHSNSFFDCSF